MLLLLQIHPLPRPIASDEQIDVSTVRPCGSDADILVLVLTVLVVIVGGESANHASGPILRGAFLEGNDVGLGAKDLVPETDFHLGETVVAVVGRRRSRCIIVIVFLMAEDGTQQIGRVLVPPTIITGVG